MIKQKFQCNTKMKVLMLIPFLTSAYAILTTEFPVDQSGNIVVSSLVFVLFVNILHSLECGLLVHSCGTHPTRGESTDLSMLNLIICSQRLFLSCKNKCFSFNFQVTFSSPLPGLISL